MRETYDWGGNWLFSDRWGSSQSIIQFSVFGRGCIPFCYLTWGQTIVEVMMIIATSFKRFHACIAVLSVPTPQQATFDPCLCQRLLNTHGHVWVNLLWGHGSFLLGSTLHKVLFVPSTSLFPQSCVSPGGCVVRLIATSSKRTLCHTKAPAPAAVYCWLTSAGDTQTRFCLSLGGISGSWCAQDLFELSEHLWWYEVWFHVILPLLLSCWSFALWHGVSPQSLSSAA